MLSGFAIILENDILYCSNDSKYTTFEIVIFVQILIDSINRKRSWRLNNIFFSDQNEENESMILKHTVLNQSQNLFYCVIGDFNSDTGIAVHALEEFSKNTNDLFRDKIISNLKTPSEQAIFRERIETVIFNLKQKYSYVALNEYLDHHIGIGPANKILYAGISNQGLPIISKLYDNNLLHNTGKEYNRENMEMFCSDLSAKLATIAMNTIIRANMHIKEIQIRDVEEMGFDKIILYASINNYSVDFVASGNFNEIKEIFRLFHDRISGETIFNEDFTGDLKPYKHLSKYLEELSQYFDN
ncbi:MAG: hypothetical protein JW891_12705 [Candidatus Lokiarchaeota archaeon]|nr:hypothetical protein [Candidatus Lokiarchaeota archaeon]